MATARKRSQQAYDHRLRQLVRATGDPTLVLSFGVPRSTARGWVHGDARSVVTAEVLDLDHVRLQHEVLRLRQQNRKLIAVIRLLLTLVRVLGGRLDHRRLPEGTAKASLLQAIEDAQPELSLRGALRVLRLSPARYHQWRRAERKCGLDDSLTCPRSTPLRLTAEEVWTMKTRVEAPEYRHVPTGRLAILAQRLGKVFAAPATWYKLVRERGWRRPRMRLYPVKPTKGIRASEPDGIWHIDTTIIKLVDNTKIYLHTAIDNFSRKILAWCVAERFEITNTVTILREAAHGAISAVDPPTVVADSGVENVTAGGRGLSRIHVYADLAINTDERRPPVLTKPARRFVFPAFQLLRCRSRHNHQLIKTQMADMMIAGSEDVATECKAVSRVSTNSHSCKHSNAMTNRTTRDSTAFCC